VSRPPRGLSPEEADLWARVAATVKPLHAKRAVAVALAEPGPSPPPPPKRLIKPNRVVPAAAVVVAKPAEARPLDRHGLDASWERKLAKAAVSPDFTLDLHGHTLDGAHTRLDHGLQQAIAQGARLVLLITGRPRPADERTARGERRGAIRAKLLDWLAAGAHAHRIAAVRQAHPRHGGAGAVYIVLKRPK
jgi:DNA-nicking Smr family endonuclease